MHTNETTVNITGAVQDGSKYTGGFRKGAFHGPGELPLL